MTELLAESRELRARIDVSYQSPPLLGFLVPIEMHERYEMRKEQSIVDGTATYGNFRRFTVKVDEQFAPIEPPKPR